MGDTPHDDFREYTYRDELIDDIQTLYGIITRESSAAQPLELDFMSTQELEGLMAQMEASFRRYIGGRAKRGAKQSAVPASWNFDDAVRSPVSRQDIVERSG